jgi:taurine dioxygenase
MMRNIQSSEFFSVEPLRDDMTWGVKVSNLDPDDLVKPQIRAELYDLWIREGVVVFKGMTSLDKQLELSRIFGPLLTHPTRESVAVNARELMDVKYEPGTGWLMEVDGELRGSWLPWHSDLIYVNKINHGGILRPVNLPGSLGATGFIDKIAAYERLPERLKSRISGLHVVYKYDMDVSKIRFGNKHKARVVRYSEVTAKIQNRIHEFPRVIHPIVYKQPQTARRVLNVSSWFAVGIWEMPGPEGDELLEEVVTHAVDEQFAYFHCWTMNEMVLWDNWRMLHSAQGNAPDQTRFMQRTTIGGDYGLGRFEFDDGGAKEQGDYVQV